MENHIVLVFLLAVFSFIVDIALSQQWLGKWKEFDIDAHAKRPCPALNLTCVRDYLASNSDCEIVEGLVPEPAILERLTIPLPYANITLVLNNAKVTGVNGRLVEFTINKKTNNLVIAAEMRNLTFYIPKATFRYYRELREPIVLSDELIVTYEIVTFTGIIPNITNLDLSTIEVFSYIANSRPPYAIGPGIIKSFDREVQRSFNRMVSNVPDVVKEAFVAQGALFLTTYIQHSLCNFGLNVTIS